MFDPYNTTDLTGRNYVLVWKTSLGFYGAPLAVAVLSPTVNINKISYWLMAFLLILYILYGKTRPFFLADKLMSG